jgi:hypothetical protein
MVKAGKRDRFNRIGCMRDDVASPGVWECMAGESDISMYIHLVVFEIHRAFDNLISLNRNDHVC